MGIDLGERVWAGVLRDVTVTSMVSVADPSAEAITFRVVIPAGVACR